MACSRIRILISVGNVDNLSLEGLDWRRVSIMDIAGDSRTVGFERISERRYGRV